MVRARSVFVNVRHDFRPIPSRFEHGCADAAAGTIGSTTVVIHLFT
jgi:hypothetical protein